MNDTPTVLMGGRMLPALEAALAERYDLTRLADQPDPAAFLAEHGGRFTAYVAGAAHGLPAATLAALPNLRVVSQFGVGLDKLDLPALRARGVAVGFTPDVLNDCVADLAFTLLLDSLRGVAAADRFVRRGDWLRGPYPLTRRATGLRLGVVGMGRIGREIAERSRGFRMDVRYHTRRPVAGLPWAHEPSLHALARWCDALVLITSGGASTHHLVDASVLQALGPQGFLINVARGSVVDQAALVQALQQGTIAGAGLDVYEDEPRVPEALRALDNVVLAPHMASGTRETRQAMADLVMENLAAFFAHGAVRHSALG
mgnify:FL=1